MLRPEDGAARGQAGMANFESFWHQVQAVWRTGVFGVTLGEILASAGILIVFLLARRLFSYYVIGLLRRVVARTETEVDDQVLATLEAPLRFLFVVVGLYFAGQVAPFPAEVAAVLDRVIRSLIAFTLFWTLYRAVEPATLLINRATGLVGSAGLRESLRGFFSRVLKFVVAALGLAAILQAWDFNVGAVLGGLGLIGAAVAFGAQNLIANLFSGLLIFTDRICEKGDWIRTPDVEGTVEDIGFRTTKVRRFDKALVTLPNAKLGDEAVVNFSRMTNRRIYWTIGLEYRTTIAQLKQVVQGITDYVADSDEFETDPARTTTLINVDSFNASSIDIMLYCFTKTTKWGEWMEVKERLLFEVKRLVEDAGTGFAFPSSSVYVEKWPFGAPEAFPGGPLRGTEA